MGGTNGADPVAITNTSYPNVEPFEVVTALAERSMEMTDSPNSSSTSAATAGSRMVRSSAVHPLKYELR